MLLATLLVMAGVNSTPQPGVPQPDYGPLYQAAYMLGGLALRSLHEEAVTNGGMKERDFNDTLLTYGSIPIELVRAGVLNKPLTRDSEPAWNFAGEIPATR